MRGHKTWNKINFDRNQLYDLYMNKKLNTIEIGKKLGCSYSTIYNALKRFNIPVRSISEAQKGRKPWNKGLTKKTDKRLDYYRPCNFLKNNTPWNKGLTKEMDKRVLSVSEKLTGIHPSKKSRLKMSKNNCMHSKEVIDKMLKTRKKTGSYNIPNSGQFQEGHKESKETRNKRLESLSKNSKIKPNKPEKLLIKLFKQLNLTYKYVGDFKFWIEGFNPDFINTNGQKKIIEMYGDYWHNLPNIKERDKIRIQTYSKYGYKTLIIWEHELKKNRYGEQLPPNLLINKIMEFGK